MSTIEAKVVAVEVLPHENAERLELARIGGEGGWICVVGKQQFKTGDLCLYVPEDSILPQPILDYLAKNSKIQIHGGRIRPTKIRGVLSQGLCLDVKDWVEVQNQYEGFDATESLGIKKFEPPPPRMAIFSPKGVSAVYRNDNFKVYKGIERFQKNPKTFKPGEHVVVTIKYHGTNFRSGFAKKPHMTFWDRVKKFFTGKYQETEFLVGSHEKIRKPGKRSGDSYKTDLYWRAALKYHIEDVAGCIAFTELAKECIIYGEIIGPGIQKGYDYGIPEGEIELRVFDIMVDGRYLNHTWVEWYCQRYSLPMVEVLFNGNWDLSLLKLAEATDEYGGKKYVREGVVVKLHTDDRTRPFRAIAKHLNPAYLLDKTNSEFH